jgi:hypothetical protein
MVAHEPCQGALKVFSARLHPVVYQVGQGYGILDTFDIPAQPPGT